MTPEKRVENKIKQTLDQMQAAWIKTHGESYTKKGIPDILVTYQGKSFQIELKKPCGGVPTPIQIMTLAQYARNGGYALITNTCRVCEYIQTLNPKLVHTTYFTDKRLARFNPCHKTPRQRQHIVDAARKLWQDYQDLGIVRIKWRS